MFPLIKAKKYPWLLTPLSSIFFGKNIKERNILELKGNSCHSLCLGVDKEVDKRCGWIKTIVVVFFSDSKKIFDNIFD